MKALIKISIIIIISITIVVLILITNKLFYGDVKFERHSGMITNLKKYEPYKIENTSKYQSNHDILINIILPHSFKGKVYSKFVDKMNHNDECLEIITATYYFDLHTRVDFDGPDNGLFNYVSLGDSLFKNAGSLIITVKKGGNYKNFKVSNLEKYWVNPYFKDGEIP